MRNREHRISLRLTPEEVEEIKEFLTRNPKFKNISELFRHAVTEYISRVNSCGENVDSEDNLIINFSLSPALERVIDNFVDFGVFRSRWDAREKIVNYIELKIPSLVRDFLVEEFKANYMILSKFEEELVKLERELGLGGGKNERRQW